MRLLFLLLVACGTYSCHSQQSNLQDRIKAVENNLAPDMIFGDTVPELNLLKQMEAYGINGLSIAVIKDYKLDWAKGYGWADREEKRPVTINTRFQAASISKSINSLALLKLVQQKKIEPDTDIIKYLKSWKFPYDSLSKDKKINLVNLLSHTAGISVHGFRGYTIMEERPTVLQILDGTKPANSKPVRSLFEPGLKFQYAGGGTTITQLLLTDITGKRYEEYMQQHVLKPVGMSKSFFTQPPAAATPELATADTNGKAIDGKYPVYPEQAAAGLWTTPSDLSKYIIETQLAYKNKSAKVLNQALTQKRLTPYIDSNAALGVFIVKKGDDRYFNHNGGNEGFLCTSYGSIEGGNGVVIMINGDKYSIIPEVLNSVARVYGWKDFYKPVFKPVYYPSKDTLAKYVGKYLLFKDTIAINFCGETLCARQNGQPASGFNLIFTSSTECSIPEIPNASIRMLFQEEKVSSFELTQGGKFIANKLD
jgi:CubicO group peptidase (beta-lactamase class C family)